MKRVIEFIASKRAKDDLVILFDGRSRPCRKVMEATEDKLAASGAHAIVECWVVFVQLAKHEDARVLERLANEARASGALCRLRQQAELLQRRTVLGGGGHVRCGWPPARVVQRW